MNTNTNCNEEKCTTCVGAAEIKRLGRRLFLLTMGALVAWTLASSLVLAYLDK